MIRTSGGGNRDLTMLAVPLAMLLAFALFSGGGLEHILRTTERTLWVVVDWVGELIS